MKYGMQKVRIISSAFFAIFLLLQITPVVQAAEKSTEVTVRVTGPVATASGVVSPNAKVSAKVDEFRMGETNADNKGSFRLDAVGIYLGATSLCFEVEDVKSFGASLSCTQFKAVTEDILLEDLFLPPTIGLVNKKIEEGQDALLRGYSMPEIKVEVTQKGGNRESIDSDKEGYYSKIYKNLRVGTYSFTATASYNGKQALAPLGHAELEVVAKGSLTGARITEVESQIFLWVLAVLFIIIFAAGIAIFILTQTPWGRRMLARFKKSKAYAKGLKIYETKVHPFLLKYKLTRLVRPGENQVQVQKIQGTPPVPASPQNPETKKSS